MNVHPQKGYQAKSAQALLSAVPRLPPLSGPRVSGNGTTATYAAMYMSGSPPNVSHSLVIALFVYYLTSLTPQLHVSSDGKNLHSLGVDGAGFFALSSLPMDKQVKCPCLI